MVGFRKLFPVLAVAALSVSAASAATDTIKCTASADQTPLRSEGLTEAVGPITLTCKVAGTTAGGVFTPTTAAAGLTASFQIQTDGPSITSPLTDADKGTSTVTMTVNAGADKGVAKAGTLVNAKTVQFTGIKLDYAPADFGNAVADGTVEASFTIVIDGVRLNATQAVSQFAPIKMSVNGVAVGVTGLALDIDGSPVIVAAATTGLNFSVASAITLNQCSAAGAPATDAAVAGQMKVAPRVIFTSGFKGAFKDSEVGGADDHGTFLVARFKNVPAGARLYVGNINVDDNGGLVAGVSAVLDQSSGATVPAAAAWKEITVGSDGTAEAVWQVVDVTNAAATQALSFPVYVRYDNTVALGQLQADGNFFPISDVGVADKGSDVPRFGDANLAYKPIATLKACATTLLFPYVTNDSGWDTGIAISNTSADVKLVSGNYYMSGNDKAQPGQTGNCSLYYFGTKAPEAALTTTVKVAAGETLALTTSTGSAEKFGIPATPGFTGYVVAQCDFQYAHGFAFMSGPGAAGPAGVGYNALVLEGRTAGAGVNETLGN